MDLGRGHDFAIRAGVMKRPQWALHHSPRVFGGATPRRTVTVCEQVPPRLHVDAPRDLAPRVIGGHQRCPDPLVHRGRVGVVTRGQPGRPPCHMADGRRHAAAPLRPFLSTLKRGVGEIYSGSFLDTLLAECTFPLLGQERT